MAAWNVQSALLTMNKSYFNVKIRQQFTEKESFSGLIAMSNGKYFPTFTYVGNYLLLATADVTEDLILSTAL
jgi:hypothetical protein